MPTLITRTSAALTAVVTALIILAGCGQDDSQPVTYTPAAYGIPGHCYYVDDPAEAIALRADGRCPASWAPTLMPVAWHERYYPYYDSPAYYGRYVPARSRTVFTQHETTFGHANKTVIAKSSKTGTYRSSAGGTVSGAKVTTGKVHFGSGTSFGQTGTTHGGGTGRSGGGTVSHGGGTGRSGGSSSGHSGGFGGHGGGGGR